MKLIAESVYSNICLIRFQFKIVYKNINFILKYAIRKMHENQVALKLNATHQLLVYADVNVSRDNINTTKKNKDALIDATKDVGLEVNMEKTKCMSTSHHQNAHKIIA
jgi:hypothetical protein